MDEIEILLTSRSLQDEGGNATPSAAPSGQETVSESNDAQIIRETLRVYGSIYLVMFFTFCYVRRRFNKYFNIRTWVPELESDLAKSCVYSGWFDWTWKVMQVNDTLLLQNIGMDGLCFIRCLRLGAKLSFGGVLNSVWLIPLFLTAENEDGNVIITDKFAKISVANIGSGSPRMAGVVVAAYIMLFYALRLISRELDWYAEFRHKYLSQRLPRNYAIYVSGIPEELRSDFALGDYFRSWSSEGAVIEAHIAMDCPSLDADVAKRQNLIVKLEHLIAKEKIKGIKAQHRSWSLKNIFGRGAVTEKVDSVAAYREELDKLNHKISLAIGKLSNRNHRMRQFLSKEHTLKSRRALNIPVLSPLSEQDGQVFFSPEESLGDESIEYLFSDQQGDNEMAPGEAGGVKSLSHTEDLSESSGEKGRFVASKVDGRKSPTHPFLQLLGMDFDLNHNRNSANKDLSQQSPPENAVEVEHEAVQVDPDIDLQSDPELGTSGANLDVPQDSFSRRSEQSLIMQNETLEDKPKNSSRSRKLTAHSVKKISDRVLHGASTGVVGSVNQVKKVTGASVQRAAKAADFGLHSAKKAADFGLHSAKKAAEMGVSKLQQAPDLATKVKKSAAFIAPALVQEDGEPRNAGFVVFRDLFTCQAARQMLQHAVASKMVVEPAPPPDHIFWRNVGLPENAKKTGRLLSVAATTSLCFFWSIPVAFLSSLTEVDSLQEKLPLLAVWAESFPGLDTFLATLAPLLLLILNEGILPNALKWFSTWEGLVGSPQLEASTFVKLSAFVIIQTFFVSAISGSILSELANILDNPEDIVILLGNSLATQSSYFIQIVLVFTFLVQGMALLRVVPLATATLRRFVGPRLTARERRKTWKFARSLEDPAEFFHAEVFAQIILFYVVLFVYAPIAPITCIFLWPCFLICESGYRYNFIHNHKKTPDSGGRIFKGFSRVLLASIFIGELTLLGTLGLKQAVYAVPALVPLLIITTLYAVLVYPKKIQVAESLPTILSVELDHQKQEEGMGSDFLINQYYQPSLKHKVLIPEEYFDE